MNVNKIFLIILSVIIIILIWQVIHLLFFYEDNRITLKKMEELINQSLQIGDSKDKVIIFFETQKFEFNYDNDIKRFRYVHPKLENHFHTRRVLEVLIYLDKLDNFISYEVSYIYESIL